MTRFAWLAVAVAFCGCKAEKVEETKKVEAAEKVAKADDAEAPTPTEAPADVPRDEGGNVFACRLDKGSGRIDCEGHKWGCQGREGCTERADAWCFPSKTQWRGTPTRDGLACTVDRAACEAWHKLRVDHPDPPTGPCALTQPSTYAKMREAQLEDIHRVEN